MDAMLVVNGCHYDVGASTYRRINDRQARPDRKATTTNRKATTTLTLRPCGLFDAEVRRIEVFICGRSDRDRVGIISSM